MIRTVVNNDDYEVGSGIAMSESFGSTLPSSYEVRYRGLDSDVLARVFSHRIRIYVDKCAFTYNEGLDSIEDNNCEESVARHIIDVIRPILNAGPSI